jgi:sorbose reductase
MATNLDSTFFCAIAVGRHWRRQIKECTNSRGEKLEDFKKGSFVATGSVMARVAGRPQMQAPYNVAKAGVVHLYQFLPLKHGMRVQF